MSKPTEHTDAGSLPLRGTGQPIPRIGLPTRAVLVGGTGPPVDSPLKVFNGTEWVSTGINVVLPP